MSALIVARGLGSVWKDVEWTMSDRLWFCWKTLLGYLKCEMGSVGECESGDLA